MTPDDLDAALAAAITRHHRGLTDDFRGELPRLVTDLRGIAEQHADDILHEENGYTGQATTGELNKANPNIGTRLKPEVAAADIAAAAMPAGGQRAKAGPPESKPDPGAPPPAKTPARRTTARRSAK